MKNIFHGLLIVTPAVAVILFFSLEGKEEIKADQRVQQANQAVQQQAFDNQFQDAWNGEPGAKIREERNEQLADLQKKAAEARARRDELDETFIQSEKDLKAALSDAGQDDMQAASAVAAAKKKAEGG